MIRGVVSALVVAVLVLPMSAVADTSSASVGTRQPSLERLVLQEINAVRASYGLEALAPSNGLARAALRHTRSMVTNGYFAHESWNGTPFWKRVEGFYSPRSRGWAVGENLATFGEAAPTAADVVSAWMASPPHRANLLSKRFAEAGIAIVYAPSAGGVYGDQSTWVVTLDFGAR